MRLLVTGGSGFTGRQLLPLAAAAGYDVVALARTPAAATAVRALGARPVTGDLDDAASVDAAFRAAAGTAGDTALVNLASLGFGHAGTIVAAAEDAGLTRAVFLSTTAITTRLPAPSKRIRLAAEATIAASGLDWTILRPTMIYGAPGDRNMARLLATLRRTPVVPLPGGGRHLQQPVHVDDLARATLAAVRADAAIGRTYDVAGPVPLTFREVVTEAAAAVGRRPRFVPVPLGPMVGAARTYEQVAGRLHRRPRVTAEQLERLAEDKAFPIDAAGRDLGYAPRSFGDGIRAEAAQMATGTAGR